MSENRGAYVVPGLTRHASLRVQDYQSSEWGSMLGMFFSFWAGVCAFSCLSFEWCTEQCVMAAPISGGVCFFIMTLCATWLARSQLKQRLLHLTRGGANVNLHVGTVGSVGTEEARVRT